jgi:hypothetical protein
MSGLTSPVLRAGAGAPGSGGGAGTADAGSAPGGLHELVAQHKETNRLLRTLVDKTDTSNAELKAVSK